MYVPQVENKGYIFENVAFSFNWLRLIQLYQPLIWKKTRPHLLGKKIGQSMKLLIVVALAIPNL